MASKNIHSDGIVEECEECGCEQPHEVSIDILAESDEVENCEFSREPYRISECQGCGATSRTRMNNA
jgi:hypothetical protein